MNTFDFSLRHIGPSNGQIDEMCNEIGISSVDDLLNKTIPQSILLKKEMQLPEAISEYELIQELNTLGNSNIVSKNYIGMGYHPTILPPVIQRNILENPGWYTAYTPYQAEISQGRMEALINFQTAVISLTGMEIANASLLDESTAAAEAMSLLHASRSRAKKKSKASVFLIEEGVLPQTIDILKTRAIPIGIELKITTTPKKEDLENVFGILFQYPKADGALTLNSSIVKHFKENDIRVAVAADIISLAVLKSPGSMGADVVVGTTQRFGIPMGYGGPHAAFFATKEEFKRNIPGRIIGWTKDRIGQNSLRMALQTREQHIKRDKATSNICTAQVLLAVMAGMYSVYHGKEGLIHIANHIHQLTKKLADSLSKGGVTINHKTFFDTISISIDSEKVNAIKKEAENQNINFFYSTNEIRISLNETTTEKDIEDISKIFGTTIINEELESVIPKDLQRDSDFMTDAVFSKYHTETKLMRYIKKLENKDISLTHSMISLGSCTMKLNAAAQLLSLSNPQWNSIHPFQPLSQTKGYQAMLTSLEDYLTEITGFAATFLQPNSGAQGEFAGLISIRNYHLANGNTNRTKVLIPISAHGTNPASAVMAGMEVVVVKNLENGEIDIEDFTEKINQHSQNLAGIMVTYPSTFGLFDENIKEITDLTHKHGGLVYMDGANMNAQVGYTSPAEIGADVCHLNLHKTFAIPHGGGGPGVGPICVNEKLKPHLPSHIVQDISKNNNSAISAAPYGSALICLISYAYIRMLGTNGLKKSTAIAILNANYIKSQIQKEYSILYQGKNGTVGHEMIVDFRPFKEIGIEVMDISKRLMDYGYHSPTVSFPVAGTLMIEPTESESKEELDRFIECLLSIRKEIDECALHGPEGSVLKNAPHVLTEVVSDNWVFDYGREKAAFPLDWVKENKIWPSSSRVDDAYGDRNLICSCLPMEDFVES